MSGSICVSVIIPTYNEELYINRCLETLENQSFPSEKIEWLFADGGSSDNTVEIIKKSNLKNKRILQNKKQLVTYAVNLGIKNAIGNYIIRMDAHASYERNYIEKCIYYLENTDADNVGGIAKTVGKGFIGEANAEVLSSKFGVGNSQFRTSEKSGYVDTVPFGAFKREIFDKIGVFDPELPRSEDNEFNSRIREMGGKVYLASDIRFTYYCRSTVRDLLWQAIQNGNALFLTLYKNPKAMKIRHYIPFFFVISLVAMPILANLFITFKWLFVFEISLYLLLDLYFSFLVGNIKFGFYKIIMYPLFHIAYGIGSLLGLVKIKIY